MIRRILCRGVLIFAAAGTLLCGCGAGDKSARAEETPRPAEEEKKQEETSDDVLGGNIGICFPDENDQSQAAEAREIADRLEKHGYEVETVYAGGDGKKQANQVSEMIGDKKSCLVILPIDSENLAKPLGEARKQGVTVVCYDRIAAGTEDISYYVGFDYESVGESIGSYLVENCGLDSAKAEKQSYTMEFFMGDVDDQNCRIQHRGIMKILQPYMKQKVLQVKSLRTSYEDVSIVKESSDIAEQTCSAIMQANYLDRPVDAVCVGTDSIMGGIVKALEKQNGFEEDWPVVAGCGISREAFARLRDGLQSMLVCNYREDLPRLCADLVHKDIQNDKIDGLQKYDNGTGEIPAIFGETEIAYRDNYQQIMKDMGISLE